MTLPGAEVLERAGLKAWPGIDMDYNGTWIRRVANGYARRANSMQPLDPADDDDAPARIDASCEWLRVGGVVPIFGVTPLCGPRVVQALNAARWNFVDRSHLFAMELGPRASDPRTTLYDALDPVFLAAQQRLQHCSAEMTDKFRALLAAVAVPCKGVVLDSALDLPVASALMVVADEIAVTGNVITNSRYRRQGLGAAVMRSGLAWAREAGAMIASLNVQADNPAGQALYESLGYRHQYDYVYRLPGAT